jgi:hypothetical protein
MQLTIFCQYSLSKIFRHHLNCYPGHCYLSSTFSVVSAFEELLEAIRRVYRGFDSFFHIIISRIWDHSAAHKAE